MGVGVSRTDVGRSAAPGRMSGAARGRPRIPTMGLIRHIFDGRVGKGLAVRLPDASLARRARPLGDKQPQKETKAELKDPRPRR